MSWGLRRLAVVSAVLLLTLALAPVRADSVLLSTPSESEQALGQIILESGLASASAAGQASLGAEEVNLSLAQQAGAGEVLTIAAEPGLTLGVHRPEAIWSLQSASASRFSPSGPERYFQTDAVAIAPLPPAVWPSLLLLAILAVAWRLRARRLAMGME